MTSPTSRRTVRLGSLLTGTRKLKDKVAGDLKPDISEDDFLDSIDSSTIVDWTMGDSSPPKIVGSSQFEGTPSKANAKGQKISKSPSGLVDSIDCELLEETSSPRLSIKQILSGRSQSKKKDKKHTFGSKNCENIPDVEVIRVNDPKKNRETHERIMSALGSAKKTSVKKLFNNFQKRSRNNEESSEVAIEEFEGMSPLHRMHAISALEYIEAPLPLAQLVSDNDDTTETRTLSLPKRKHHAISPSTLIDPSEYTSLTSLGQAPKQQMEQNPLTTKKRVNQEAIWTADFEPRTLEDVLLPDNLKNGIEEWLDQAFVKLRKRTTRKKLFKKEANVDEELDWFVVKDDYDSTDDQVEEFVPLMILCGKPTGKNTILKVLMDLHAGHIFEVNTSGNRSKKDFVERVLDFSTTHYVKDKGSKGIILFDDVDVLFKERDKFFWGAIERILVESRRPVVLTCQDINFIPFNFIQIAQEENSLFFTQEVELSKAINLLQSFLETKNIETSRQFLEKTLKQNKGDIRKCLMELQWLSLSEYCLVENEAPEPTITIADLASGSLVCELLSDQDLISSSAMWRSSILEDEDLTVNYAIPTKDFTGLSDEQRLAFDYMVDYKQHLRDSLRHPKTPYDTDIGSYLRESLIDPHRKQDLGTSTIYQEAAVETIRFLDTRIQDKMTLNNDQYTTSRMTRNSRKVKEIVDRYANDSNEERSSYNEQFISSVSMMTKTNFCLEVIPLICEVAKRDKVRKIENRSIYLDAIKGVTPEREKDVVMQLLQDHAFHPIWFRGDPDMVIKTWNIGGV